MEDLTKYFPGCKLNTEQLRIVIKKCIRVKDNDYFCYKCFKFLGVGIGIPKNCYLCKKCYQFYCNDCGYKYRNDRQNEIDPSICIQCIDTNKYNY